MDTHEFYPMERNDRSTCLGLLIWEYKLGKRDFPETVNPYAVVGLHTFLKDVILGEYSMETFDGLLDHSLYNTYGVKAMMQRERQMRRNIQRHSAEITEFLQNGPTAYFTEHWERTPMKWIVSGLPERMTLNEFIELVQKNCNWFKPIKGIGPVTAQKIMDIVDEHLTTIGHPEKGGMKNE